MLMLSSNSIMMKVLIKLLKPKMVERFMVIRSLSKDKVISMIDMIDMTEEMETGIGTETDMTEETETDMTEETEIDMIDVMTDVMIDVMIDVIADVIEAVLLQMNPVVPALVLLQNLQDITPKMNKIKY